MMKNTLGDLTNLWFAQLEKRGDDDLNGEEMDAEIRRAEHKDRRIAVKGNDAHG